MSIVPEFIECEECEFVLVAAPSEEPEPRRVDECPSCGSTEFSFTGR